ncbi:hypothetical protein CHARACLAT_009211 [Characodon lateralis]|uniref:Uncharacterized protein n=1 Tax=Characodon lateralis TaxID=208331 RepID=A0ABU7CWW8_9TELE|nr:hypothetical protein [Characodon lateralis]
MAAGDRRQTPVTLQGQKKYRNRVHGVSVKSHSTFCLQERSCCFRLLLSLIYASVTEDIHPPFRTLWSS